jgi:hypothetical protein
MARKAMLLLLSVAFVLGCGRDEGEGGSPA